MKIINIGFIAHVDAGKTTLTENILYKTGALRKIGKVDEGTSTTDYLSIEKRRGISVRASSVTVHYKDTQINIVDTPGHIDFISEVERSLATLDAAILVVSSVEGIQAQTRTLIKAVDKLKLPTIIFINKLDRVGSSFYNVRKDLEKIITPLGHFLLDIYQEENNEPIKNKQLDLDILECLTNIDDEILEQYLNGNLEAKTIHENLNKNYLNALIYPVLCGSGKTASGITELLDFIIQFPQNINANENDELCAYIYKVEFNDTFGKVCHARIFHGSIASRMDVYLPRTNTYNKITQLKRVQGEKLIAIDKAGSNELCALCGLTDAKAGDFIGSIDNNRICNLSIPMFNVKVECESELKNELLAIATKLSDEDPTLGVEWIESKQELNIKTTGKIQLETLKEIILEKYHLNVSFSKPSVIYKETPIKKAYGFEAYTMPKPCWAVVKLLIEPLPLGRGIEFESIVSDNAIRLKYQDHVKACIYDSVKEGLLGWEVTDCKFTLVDGEDHIMHTHPLDFFVATPVALMDGLRNSGVRLLEPFLKVTFITAINLETKIISFIHSKRGVVVDRMIDNETVTLISEIPVEQTFELYEEFAVKTSGKGICQAEFLEYRPAPVGTNVIRERTSVNPLDRAKWILYKRQAL